jgi:dihydropteroate synthase
VSFLRARMEAALGEGVAPEQIVLDPGPDFAKTPAQTVAVLRSLDAVRRSGRPLLLAISRKDFLGAIVGPRARRARSRDLAAVGFAAMRARRSCACTTSPAPPTTSRCGPCCAASACSVTSRV